ncbi:MAG: hypothetical protein M1470_09585 [Bacteroidetes bacterium]|nr:hypothetical protein [Bacteroidota bacterium]MCL5737509.1 hypothetical protein [Bacteroidota bacterium]
METEIIRFAVLVYPNCGYKETVEMPVDALLVPKLRLGNAVLEALLPTELRINC